MTRRISRNIERRFLSLVFVLDRNVRDSLSQRFYRKNQNRVNTHLGIGFHFPFGVSRDRPCDALETNDTAQNVAKRLWRTTAAVRRKSVLGTVKRAWRGTLANWSKSYHRRTAKNFLIHLATDEFRMLLLIGFVER